MGQALQVRQAALRQSRAGFRDAGAVPYGLLSPVLADLSRRAFRRAHLSDAARASVHRPRAPRLPHRPRLLGLAVRRHGDALRAGSDAALSCEHPAGGLDAAHDCGEHGRDDRLEGAEGFDGRAGVQPPPRLRALRGIADLSRHSGRRQKPADPGPAGQSAGRRLSRMVRSLSARCRDAGSFRFRREAQYRAIGSLSAEIRVRALV